MADHHPEGAPPYVWHLLDALIDGQPLDFGGHEVPHEVQAHLQSRTWAASAVREAFQKTPNRLVAKLPPQQFRPLKEAEDLVFGPRAASYGHPITNFGQTGRMWGALLKIDDIPPWMVALMMVAVKLSRETNAHNYDNIVDSAGYTATWFRTLYEDEEGNAVEPS